MIKMAWVGAAALLASTAGMAGAQVTKTLPGETRVLTVSVEAIERASREVTVKKPDGTYDVLYVPAAVERFDTLKIGDRITARYYENVVLQLKPTGQQDVNTSSDGRVKAPGGLAATSSRQRTMTATIAAIDARVPSITFTGPNGWNYSSRVDDTDALARVKVGDKVDITWTEALVVSLDPSR